MHLIQSLKKEFCFDLPVFSKYLATSINSYFYKMTLDVYKVFDEIHVDETIKCYVNVRSMSLKDVVANIFIIMRLDVQLFNGKFI